jgi:hypothetical protein
MAKSELEQIPDVDKNMAKHMMNADIPTFESLKGADPEEIYLRDCAPRWPLCPLRLPPRRGLCGRPHLRPRDAQVVELEG